MKSSICKSYKPVSTGTKATKKTLAFVSGWIAKHSSPENPFAPPIGIQSIENGEERMLQAELYYVQIKFTRIGGVTTYALAIWFWLQSAAIILTLPSRRLNLSA
jgi:hypothetical protein